MVNPSIYHPRVAEAYELENAAESMNTTVHHGRPESPLEEYSEGHLREEPQANNCKSYRRVMVEEDMLLAASD